MSSPFGREIALPMVVTRLKGGEGGTDGPPLGSRDVTFKAKRVRVKWQSFAHCARRGVEYYRSRGVSMTAIPGRGTGGAELRPLNEETNTIQPSRTVYR
jgi:hypothetical protein